MKDATSFLEEHEKSKPIPVLQLKTPSRTHMETVFEFWTSDTDQSQPSSSEGGCTGAVLVGFTGNMWVEQMAAASSH